MTLKKKIFSIIIVFLIVLIGGAGVYAFSIVHSVTGSDIDENNLSINTNIKKTGIVNVALFGIDGRDEVDGEEVEGDRTDTIMIASINFDTGDVKVVSIMRDLIVRIAETDVSDSYLEKINAAYAFGGKEAEIRTLNENFDLNISDYVIVNFDCMIDVVDALGGVDVDIKNDDVLFWTNQYIGHVNAVTNHSDPLLPEGSIGMTHLTGVQALAYCRNRYSDSDYGRTARQREVVEQIAKKLMESDLLTAINLVSTAYPYVETSFTIKEISEYAQAFLSLESKNITTSRLPFDGLNTTDMINEISYVIPVNLSDNVRVLHYLLFGEANYIPSDRVESISSQIENYSGYYSYTDWSVTTPQMILDQMSITAASDTGESETTDEISADSDYYSEYSEYDEEYDEYYE